MNTLDRYALTFSAVAALLAGCGGSQPPVGAPGAMPQSRTVASPVDRGRSWMLPEAKGEDLLYVSTSNGYVYVYSYPKGQKVQTLSGFTAPAGECVDSSGDVFISARANESSFATTIYEYEHGGTEPVAELDDPGHALGCAIDHVTGNLAVANIYDSSNPYGASFGSIAIYTDAQGTPTLYYPRSFGVLLCGYDNRSRLYVSVSSGDGHEAQLARLVPESGSFKLINLNAKIEDTANFPASVQWDGKHIAISSNSGISAPVIIYRLAITGVRARVVGETTLITKKNHYAGQSWILDSKIVGIYYDRGWSHVATWRYPSGGQPVRTINHVLLLNLGSLNGTAISQPSLNGDR